MTLAVVGLATSPAAAEEDESHTHETITFTDDFMDGGLNPCTGQDSVGPAHFSFVVEEEIGTGNLHADVSVTGHELLADGFQGTLTGEEDVEIDADGNGKVDRHLEYRFSDPSTGDRFQVHTTVLLEIENWDVVDADIDVVLSGCHRG